MKVSVIAAAAAIAMLAGAASAATVHATINLTGNAGLEDSLEFTQDGLKLTVTGHLLNSDGSIGSQEKIGQYSNGLGVTNDDEYVTKYKPVWNSQAKKFEWVEYKVYTDAHFVDGRGKNEVVQFLFDKVVEIKQVWFTYNDSGEEFAFTVVDGDKGGTYFPGIDIPGKNFYSSYVFSKEWLATTFGIGATGKFDEFKIKKIAVSYEDAPPPVIPLPAAGWLLIAGLGGLAALRRKKAA
jgi:hypothetical protein